MATRVRKHKSDRAITVLTLLLLVVGLLVIYAIGPMRANFMNAAYGSDYRENYFFVHQLINVVMALGAFIVAFKLPYAILRKAAKWIMVAGLGLCLILAGLAMMGSSLAQCSLGACRWFNLSVVSFQPAELLKIGLVLYLAQLVAERKKEGKLEKSADFWVPFGVVCGLSLFFVVVLQKDLGTGVSLIAIILAILFMSGISMKKFGIVVGAIVLCGVGAVVTSPHRLERLLTFGGGENANTYHIDNAMIAIGTGGFSGVGIGNSVQATGYLPESINDSVFAVMGETFGFVRLTAVVICFAVLLTRLMKTAETLPDLEESLVVVGVFAWIMAHVVVNIAAMTGLIPLTGITLPLLSYGGTSMIFVAMALGLAAQLSCYTGREVRNENIDSRRRIGRTRDAGRRSSKRIVKL